MNRPCSHRITNLLIIHGLIRDESGLETVEVAVLTGLIVGAVVTALSALGVWVAAQYLSVQNTVGA